MLSAAVMIGALRVNFLEEETCVLWSTSWKVYISMTTNLALSALSTSTAFIGMHVMEVFIGKYIFPCYITDKIYALFQRSDNYIDLTVLKYIWYFTRLLQLVLVNEEM